MKKMRKLLLVVSTAFMVSSTTTLSVLAEKINTNVTTEDVFSICESLWADAEEKTDSMSHEEMFGDYKTVQVSFLNDNERGQVCMSKYAMYDNYEVGDVVVVKTGHHGLAVAKIASIDDTVSRVANGREIVTKVDMGTYENRIASRKRVSELKTAMDVRINKLQRMAVLEMFSEKDPEMKALLDEYKALTEQKGEVQKDGE